MSTPRLPDPIGSVPPEPGTLAAVIRTARHRRVRRLQSVVGASAAVLVVALVATTMSGGDGSQTIGVTDRPGSVVAADDSDRTQSGEPQPTPTATNCTTFAEPDGSTTVGCSFGREDDDASGAPTPVPAEPPVESPSGTPGEPTATANPSPTKSLPPRSSASPAPTPEPRPTYSGQPTKPSPSAYPSPTPDPRPSDEPSQEARGEMTRTYVEGSMQCPDGQEWCAAPTPPPAGRPLQLAVRACRDADAGPGQLETGPPGADFSVHDGSSQVWRWSSGQAFPAVMMSLDVDAGDCLEWRTTWNGVDDANRRLPAGRYDGVAYVTAEPVRTPMKFVITLA